MKDSSEPVARQRTCPIAVRTLGSQDGREPPSKNPKGILGYKFPAVPQSLWDTIREHAALPPPPRDLPEGERRKVLNDRLRDVDANVLGVMLNFRRRTTDSCWCSKETIAQRIGKTTKTVQQSIRRLSLHGFIEQVSVEAPDPDDPRNVTGWRIVFLFVPEARCHGRGPDRRPPLERKVWIRSGGEDGGGRKPVSSPPLLFEAPVSSLPRKPVSSEGREPVSSNKSCAGASNPDGTDPDGRLGEDSETFNVVGFPASKVPERDAHAGPSPTAPGSGTLLQVASSTVAHAVPDELAWDEGGCPAAAPAIAAADDLAADMGGVLPSTPSAPLAPPVVELVRTVLGNRYASASREVLAARIMTELERVGQWRLETADGEVRPVPRFAGVLPLDDGMGRLIGLLGPDLDAALAQKRADEAASKVKAAAGQAAADKAKPAPAVKDRAEIGRMIGRIRGASGDELSGQLAERLAGPTGFNDSDRPQSESTYRNLFEALRHGRDGVTEAILQEAFEAACGRSCINRGKVFIALVKDRLRKRFQGGQR